MMHRALSGVALLFFPAAVSHSFSRLECLSDCPTSGDCVLHLVDGGAVAARVASSIRAELAFSGDGSTRGSSPISRLHCVIPSARGRRSWRDPIRALRARCRRAGGVRVRGRRGGRVPQSGAVGPAGLNLLGRSGPPVPLRRTLLNPRARLAIPTRARGHPMRGEPSGVGASLQPQALSSWREALSGQRPMCRGRARCAARARPRWRHGDRGLVRGRSERARRLYDAPGALNTGGGIRRFAVAPFPPIATRADAVCARSRRTGLCDGRHRTPHSPAVRASHRERLDGRRVRLRSVARRRCAGGVVGGWGRSGSGRRSRRSRAAGRGVRTLFRPTGEPAGSVNPVPRVRTPATLRTPDMVVPVATPNLSRAIRGRSAFAAGLIQGRGDARWVLADSDAVAGTSSQPAAVAVRRLG